MTTNLHSIQPVGHLVNNNSNHIPRRLSATGARTAARLLSTAALHERHNDMTGTNKKPKWRSIEAKPQSEAESAYLSALSDILPKLSPKEVRRIGFAIKAAFHDGAAWLEAAQLEGLCEVAQS